MRYEWYYKPVREHRVVGVGVASGSRNDVCELLSGGAATIKGVVLDLPGASATTLLPGL